MNQRSSFTIAILLAAGESRRMGQLKALLPWQGSVLLRHQVQALLDGGVDRVVVVLGHRADELKSQLEGIEGASWTLNSDYLSGKTTSLKTGIAVVNAESPDAQAILILNVAQPRHPQTIRRLLDSHEAGKGLITHPTYQGKGGHPIVLSAVLLGELASIDEATLGLKAVIQRHETDTIDVDLEAPEVLWDLNTPEDYESALKNEAYTG